ncbi:MAG: hypothetical protein Faunusvirus22_12 [Faunusvirus sp.]|jgi:hypothetical protein|uniref:Uncharacterized protein n=1 Tax=Faunusvirus sp. TaxID=2487766 RepID=A0A3G4ZZW9_9VIRU|nr:MAG: hypothetical protein Faunusvirus22_12 [Faunusvirus sp.]
MHDNKTPQIDINTLIDEINDYNKQKNDKKHKYKIYNTTSDEMQAIISLITGPIIYPIADNSDIIRYDTENDVKCDKQPTCNEKATYHIKSTNKYLCWHHSFDAIYDIK